MEVDLVGGQVVVIDLDHLQRCVFEAPFVILDLPLLKYIGGLHLRSSVRSI